MREQSKLAHVIRLNTMEGMASALAHEINQPLTAIFLYSQTCLLQLKLEEEKLDPSVFCLLNKIISQAKLASEIMTRMKSFIFKDVHFPQETDINNLIKDAIIFLDSEISHSNYRLTWYWKNTFPN